MIINTFYYSNSLIQYCTLIQRLLMQCGDLEVNPGPRIPMPSMLKSTTMEPDVYNVIELVKCNNCNFGTEIKKCNDF